MSAIIPKTSVTDQDGDDEPSDVHLYDEIVTAAERCRGLFYATMGLSNTGLEVTNRELEPLSYIGVEEADKILGLIKQWRNQREEEAA